MIRSGIRISSAAFIVLLLLVGADSALAASPETALIEKQAEQLNTDEVERYWNDLLRQYGGFFPDRHHPTLMDMIVPGGDGFSLSDVLGGLARFLFHEILYNGRLLGTIVVITVMGMLLDTLQSAFERSVVSKLAGGVTFIVLAVIAVNSFSVAIGYARSAIESMVHFMIAMIPLLLTMLASVGGVVSVTVMHPLIVFMIHTVGTLVHTVVFPLLFFSAVLYIVSSLTDKYKVTHLAGLLRNVGIGLLGVLLAVFLGVISVQGATGAATDGITLRTAKYVTGNLVPVVGKLLSDATDTVMSASVLVKNAVGLVGVIILILLCAFPALKILALALIYNLAASVMQPLGDNPVIGCLQTIGKSLLYVFAALAAAGLLFFLAITIIILSGNIAVMMR